MTGTEPDCEDDAAESCAAVKQNARTPGIWNPLPFFDTVKADGQLGNIQTRQQLLHRGADGHAARGVVGRAVGRRERAPARSRSAPASRTSRAWSTP